MKKLNKRKIKRIVGQVKKRVGAYTIAKSVRNNIEGGYLMAKKFKVKCLT